MGTRAEQRGSRRGASRPSADPPAGGGIGTCDWMRSSSAAASKGLGRKSDAPAARAARRAGSAVNALTTIARAGGTRERAAPTSARAHHRGRESHTHDHPVAVPSHQPTDQVLPSGAGHQEILCGRPTPCCGARSPARSPGGPSTGPTCGAAGLLPPDTDGFMTWSAGRRRAGAR
jgi:hypothetical protein